MHVAIIGTGWAGCTSAYDLAQGGMRVTLYDSAPQPGGRARNWLWHCGEHTHALDNGQHLMIGAYRDALWLFEELGTDTQLLRLPMQLQYTDGVSFVTSKNLPAPLNFAAGLLSMKGFNKHDKRALKHFISYAKKISWHLPHDIAVSQLLIDTQQTEKLCQRFWHPLCVGALNTRPDLASAQIFLNVLHDTLMGERQNSDFLLAKTSIGNLLPEKIVAWLKQRKHEVHFSDPVLDIETQHDQLFVKTRQDRVPYDAIVLATPPWITQRVAKSFLDKVQLQALSQLKYEPIATIYLKYSDRVRLPTPLFALPEDVSQGWFGQWVFDRGSLNREDANVLAVVISAARHLPSNIEQLVDEQLRVALAELKITLPDLQYSKTVVEKRATFSATLNRIPCLPTTLHERLVLAGDYLYPRYPATLEAAVRSGHHAANYILGRVNTEFMVD